MSGDRNCILLWMIQSWSPKSSPISIAVTGEDSTEFHLQ
jgi:hypothetical protein